MAETKEEFDALECHLKEAWREKDKPRCFNCEHRQAGDCGMFGVAIPTTEMYKYTECEQHEPCVPF